jgi:hypothetical protein
VLDHLLLTCNSREIGHVKEEAMFHLRILSIWQFILAKLRPS